jgi:hypothetical protein
MVLVPILNSISINNKDINYNTETPSVLALCGTLVIISYLISLNYESNSTAA